MKAIEISSSGFVRREESAEKAPHRKDRGTNRLKAGEFALGVQASA
jgi:hypothetical protein